MNVLDRIKKQLSAGKPVSLEEFDDVAQKAAAHRAARVRLKELEQHVALLSLKLQQENTAEQEGIDEYARAQVAGAAFPLKPPLQEQHRTALHELRAAQRVFALAASAHSEARKARSVEVCAALRTERSARLREMARLLAEAREVSRGLQLMQHALQLSGVSAAVDFLPLHFPPIAAWIDEGAPWGDNGSIELDQWYAKLRRHSVLGPREDPRKVSATVEPAEGGRTLAAILSGKRS